MREREMIINVYDQTTCGTILQGGGYWGKKSWHHVVAFICGIATILTMVALTLLCLLGIGWSLSVLLGCGK